MRSVQAMFASNAMAIVTIVLSACGCDKSPPPPPTYDTYGSYGQTGEITFLDTAATNTQVSDDLLQLELVDIDGQSKVPADYAEGRTVVLVITRGNTNPICPFCSTQTSRLIANYEKFRQRNAEVLVVYPISHPEESVALDGLLTASKKLLDNPSVPVPFPLLLDVELKAVDQLGIRKDLSKPATYIVDPDGHVRFAYVGAEIDDRPSIKAMLTELDKIVSDAPTVDEAGDEAVDAADDTTADESSPESE